MQEYSSVISVIVVIWVVLLTIRIGAYLNKKAAKDYVPAAPVIIEKSCPPHRWKWEEQPGMENVSYMWCLTCKKTPRQVGEGN